MQPSRALTRALIAALASAGVAVSRPSGAEMAKRATCTVDSVSSASSLSSCTSVVIEAFTVPSGSRLSHHRSHVLRGRLQPLHTDTLILKAAKGATVTMQGSVTFSQTTSSGPLFTLDIDVRVIAFTCSLLKPLLFSGRVIQWERLQLHRQWR